jgi:hypothetical protein
MNYSPLIIFFSSILICLGFYFSIDATTYEVVSIFLFSYFILTFLHSIGKDYNINQITILFAIFQLLIMPIIVYRVYNDDKLVAALFYNMQTPEEQYFGYILPAIDFWYSDTLI